MQSETDLGYAFDRAADGEDALVHARNDLADAGFDAGLVPEVGDIFACFPNDDASILGTDQSAEGEDVVAGGGGRTRVGVGGCWTVSAASLARTMD